MTVQVASGTTEAECLQVAHRVVPLVKTALFASDPYQGRFCMTIGRASIPELDPANRAFGPATYPTSTSASTRSIGLNSGRDRFHPCLSIPVLVSDPRSSAPMRSLKSRASVQSVSILEDRDTPIRQNNIVKNHLY